MKKYILKTNKKKEVNGIILVLSCQKYKNTRLSKFKIPDAIQLNWETIFVIGDYFLDKRYELNNNFLTIRCEDSYLHLFKKLVLALDIIYENYDIKEGILRCGDDLIFNKKNLLDFLTNQNKFDYFGKSHPNKSEINPIIKKGNIKNNWMVNFYKLHSNDIENPHHNLKDIDISKYTIFPNIINYPIGIIFYISNKSAKLIISHFKKINNNIYKYDKYTSSYPYIIEDISVSFILYSNNIKFINNSNMFANNISDSNKNNCIAIHTNYQNNFYEL